MAKAILLDVALSKPVTLTRASINARMAGVRKHPEYRKARASVAKGLHELGYVFFAYDHGSIAKQALWMRWR